MERCLKDAVVIDSSTATANAPPPPQEDPLRGSRSIMAMEKVTMRRKGGLVQISKMVSVLNLIGNIDDAIFLNQSENGI